MDASARLAGRALGLLAAEGKALKLWASVIAKIGAKDWSAMEAQAGFSLAVTTKSACADEAIRKMVVGDGNKLDDALTDYGGGMSYDRIAKQLNRHCPPARWPGRQPGCGSCRRCRHSGPKRI